MRRVLSERLLCTGDGILCRAQVSNHLRSGPVHKTPTDALWHLRVPGLPKATH